MMLCGALLQGQLCVLAEDCNQPDYKKLVEALCAEHNVSLLSVPEAKQLGQWAGVRAPCTHPVLVQPPRHAFCGPVLIFTCCACMQAKRQQASCAQVTASAAGGGDTSFACAVCGTCR